MFGRGMFGRGMASETVGGAGAAGYGRGMASPLHVIGAFRHELGREAHELLQLLRELASSSA